MICFCKNGIIAQCVAGDWANQRRCHWYQKHSYADQCSFLNKNMSNHCWSQNAQMTGYVEDMDLDARIEKVLDSTEVDTPIIEKLDARMSCHDCLHFACSDVMSMNRRIQGGLTINMLRDMKDRCVLFENKHTFGRSNP